METKEVNEIKQDILAKMRQQQEEVKSIQHIEELQLLESNSNYFGLNENDVFLVKKEHEKNNEKVITYDIYSTEGELIGTADDKGNVKLTEEYKKKLEEKYKSLYKQLGINKRKIKIQDIAKYSEKENEEKTEEIEEVPEEIVTTKKEDSKKEDKKEEIENPEQLSENEQIEKMEEGLGLDEKDIKSSSEIKDLEFYRLVPEAKEYKGNVSIVYVGSTSEFMIVGVDKKTGQYKPLDTVEASRATEVGETNKSIDLGQDGSKVEAQSLKAIINIKGDNEYSFSAKLEGLNPIELKELRRDLISGEYISSDLETTHQYPVTQKVADMMDKDVNKDISSEIKKYEKVTENGKEVTTIEQIEDEKSKVNNGDKKEEKKETTKQRPEGGRTPYDDWLEKHGMQ